MDFPTGEETESKVEKSVVISASDKVNSYCLKTLLIVNPLVLIFFNIVINNMQVQNVLIKNNYTVSQG